MAQRKIILSTFGSLGDLHPFIALGRALAQRGHEAVLATTGHYRAKVEAEGLEFFALKPELEEATSALGLDMGGIARQMARDDSFLYRKLMLPYLKTGYESARDAMAGAALAITHPFALAAKLAAEAQGVIQIDLVLSPVLFMSAYDPPQGKGLIRLIAAPRSSLALSYNRALIALAKRALVPSAAPVHALRRAEDLPPAGRHPMFGHSAATKATIALYSPLLGHVAPDFPPRTTIAGFSFYDSEKGGGEEGLPPDLAAFLEAGPAPLVFTLGSFAVLCPDAFYQKSMDVARRLNRRAVLLTTEEERDRLRAAASRDVFVGAYARHSLLFPRAAAIIHHGGIGTSGQALRAGKPQLIVPFLGDQHDNGARLTRLGVARMLPRERYSVARACAMVTELLENIGIKRRAAEAGAAVAREDGVARAADLIDTMLAV